MPGSANHPRAVAVSSRSVRSAEDVDRVHSVKQRWWLIWASGWHPDSPTVGLLVFVGFATFGLVGFLQSANALSIAFTGHPPGLPAAVAAQLAPFSIRDRLADGFLLLSDAVSIATAIGGLALVAGKRWGGRTAASGIAALAILNVVNVVLTPSTVNSVRIGSTVVGVLGLGGALAIVLWSRLAPGTAKPRLRKRIRMSVVELIRAISDRDADPEHDAALRAEIEAVFPGGTDSVQDP